MIYSPHRNSRGIILMVVLGFILLIAIFVTQFMEITARQIRNQLVELGRSDLRMTAYSALEVSLAVLSEFKEIDGGLYSSSQGWGQAMEYAEIVWPEGVEVHVNIVDESGKISIQSVQDGASNALFRALLEELGFDYGDADIMVDSYLDWTDLDDRVHLNGAEKSYYGREYPPREPANALLTQLETFRYIRGYSDILFDENGVPNNNFQAFRNSVTLHKADQVNINSASPTVLRALARETGFDAMGFTQYRQGLDDEDMSDDDFIRTQDDLSAAGISDSAGQIGFTADLLRIIVEVKSGEKFFRLTSLVKSDASIDEQSTETPSLSVLAMVENANFD